MVTIDLRDPVFFFPLPSICTYGGYKYPSSPCSCSSSSSSSASSVRLHVRRHTSSIRALRCMLVSVLTVCVRGRGVLVKVRWENMLSLLKRKKEVCAAPCWSPPVFIQNAGDILFKQQILQLMRIFLMVQLGFGGTYFHLTVICFRCRYKKVHF